MVYSVHFWYSKIGSRKSPNKFEGLVFADNVKRVKELISDFLSTYPIKPEPLSIIGGQLSLKEVYEQYPELDGILPDDGCIINEISQRYYLKKYLK